MNNIPILSRHSKVNVNIRLILHFLWNFTHTYITTAIWIYSIHTQDSILFLGITFNQYALSNHLELVIEMWINSTVLPRRQRMKKKTIRWVFVCECVWVWAYKGKVCMKLRHTFKHKVEKFRIPFLSRRIFVWKMWAVSIYSKPHML